MAETPDVLDQNIVKPENTTATNNNQTDTESYQDRNWRQFRETREKERKEKDEAQKIAKQKAEEAQALRAALEAIVNKPENSYSNSSHNHSEESEDERINKKVDAVLLAKQRKYEEELRKKEIEELPTTLSKTYSDFDKICSQENIDYLEFHHPEIHRLYSEKNEGFDKWSSLYNSIKKLIPNPDSSKDKNKAEKNLTKPQSASVKGTTGTGDTAPNYLDEKRKADNWKRIQARLKGV